MKDINSEINAIKRSIEARQRRIIKNPNLASIINDEILVLKRKMCILEERKSKGFYVPKRPELGDDRYKSSPYKDALDILRMLYYDIFSTDPSISFISEKAIFGDDTLPIYGVAFKVRGLVSFEVMLQSSYPNYVTLQENSVAINFKRKSLMNNQIEEYLRLMTLIIQKYSGNNINFICSDGLYKMCTLAYIANKEFNYYLDGTKSKEFYDFFNLLCDNVYRNIIYVGDTMKNDANIEEIERVNSEIIIPNMLEVARNLNISFEELQKENEKVLGLILR